MQGKVPGEVRARRKCRFAVIRLTSPGGNAAPDTAEEWHFRRAQAEVRWSSGMGGCHPYDGGNSVYGAKSPIQMVEYIVNPALEAAYETRKKEMTAQRGNGNMIERLMFHGTSAVNSQSIIRENFRLDKVGTVRDCVRRAAYVLYGPVTTNHVTRPLWPLWPGLVAGRVQLAGNVLERPYP